MMFSVGAICRLLMFFFAGFSSEAEYVKIVVPGERGGQVYAKGWVQQPNPTPRQPLTLCSPASPQSDDE